MSFISNVARRSIGLVIFIEYVMSIFYKTYRLLSPRMRNRVKTWVGGLGHHTSLFDSLKANKDGEGKRRLDNAFCHFLEFYSRLQNKPLTGARCLDFGAGYVISDSLVMWLLGANRVDAVDYNAIFRPSALRKAVLAMDERRLRDFSKGFDFVDQKSLTERLTLLKSIARNGDIPLNQLGIFYRAPFDATDAADVRCLESIDLVWSTSVLEHIHPRYLLPILNNLASALSPCGAMVHLIDARDHFDLEGAPFGFFDKVADYELDRDFDARGNRLTHKEWEKISTSISGVDSRVMGLKSDFSAMSSREDLRSHYYLLTAKTVNALKIA